MVNDMNESRGDNPEIYLEDAIFDRVEFADNPETRCPVALIVDTSGSMTGPPIRAINDAIAQFKSEIANDSLASLRAEVALITFSHRTIQYDFTSIEDFSPPTLEAGGGTRMSVAINTALDLLESRKQIYRDNGISYYRPIALLLTDGYPEHDSREEIASTQERLMSEEEGRRVAFFAFGVEGADMEALSQITPPNRPPKHIGNAMQVAGLFQWLSNSVAKISTSQPGDGLRLDPVEDYLDY